MTEELKPNQSAALIQIGFDGCYNQMKKELNKKDKEIARLKGNWDYLKEYLVALRNSRLHEECLSASVLNRLEILFLNQLIEKMYDADKNARSMEE